jgi:hypothetical protein
MGHRLRRTAAVFIAVASVAALGIVAGAPVAGASKADDVKTARAGVLIPSDFPTGWSGTRASSPSDAAVIKRASSIKDCKDYVALRKLTQALPKAHSLEYSDGATSTMSNVVNVFPTTSKVNARMKLFSSSSLAPCLEQYTQKAVGSNGTVTVSPANVTGLGDATVGYTVDIADASGTVVEELLTFAVPVGRYISAYTVDVKSAGAPIDTIDAAVNASVTRLQDAAG